MTRLFFAAALTAVLASTLLPASALAHERRTVGGYQLVVGFLNEPAISGQVNGLDLRVTAPADGNKPVEGLEKTLEATVIVGGGASTMALPLEPRFGQPGAYAAHFIPTREGSYIFRITGSIRGVTIDERFESGPGRFDDVRSAQTLQFPDKLPDGLTAASDVRAAREGADSARVLGAGGVLLGLAGLAVAGFAVTRVRSDRQSQVANLRARDSESRAA